MKNKILYAITFLIFIMGCKSKIDFTPIPVTYSSDILISEVNLAINTDPNAGSKRNHYVELFNGTANDIDLSNYAIGYTAVTDESTITEWNFSSTNYQLLNGTLQPNICYVISSAAADISIINKSNLTWGTTSVLSADASKPLQLSGNSAIALLKKDPNGAYLLGSSYYKIIDVFGSPLVDRVTSGGASSTRNNIMWTIAGESIDTRNRNFRRKATVHFPTKRWDISKGTTADNAQWIISSDRIWDYSDIGHHSLSPKIDAALIETPTVKTVDITTITNTTAIGGGNVITDGGAEVTSRGICWSTLHYPTIALSTKTINGAGIGTYSSNIIGLAASTTYYVRAYATNSVGTEYGAEMAFTTPVLKQSDLLISEVSTAINTDPSHLAAGTTTTLRNHYIELYNGTANAINLADYAIGYQAVSDLTTLSAWSFPSGNYLTLSATLATEKCFVIASSQCNSATIKSDVTWGTTSTLAADASRPLQLSGNSAIALLKKDLTGIYDLGGIKYKIIDVFGSPLVARVNATGTTSTRNNIIWSIAGELADTRNRTFKRKSNILDPTTDWNLSKGTTATDAQWLISGDRLWDLTNIGLKTQ